MIIPKTRIIVCQACGLVYNRILTTQKCKISHTGEHKWKKFKKSDFRVLKEDFLESEITKYGLDDEVIE